MATELSIRNLALRRLGVEAVDDLLDDSNRNRIMTDLYDQVRQSALEEFPWPFAIKRKTLCLDNGEIPDFEYTKAHELPDDYLRAISEFNDHEYMREGAFILSNSDEIKMRYIADVSDTAKFNPLFIKVFYLMLAHEAAYSLIQDKALKSGLLEELNMVFSKARSYASQESTPKDYEIDDFLTVRL